MRPEALTYFSVLSPYLSFIAMVILANTVSVNRIS